MNSTRAALARHILEYEPVREEVTGFARARSILDLPWPEGLAPVPCPLETPPRASSSLPRADILVVTWTVAEAEALADLLCPGFGRKQWYKYTRRYKSLLPQIREGAPARGYRRLGTWFPIQVGSRRVILFKSDLHLNQDGVRTGPGTATLPVAELWRQLLREVRPGLVLTTGTAGATYPDHALGDVWVTRAARFRLSDEFKNEAWNGKSYASSGEIPKGALPFVREHLARFTPRLTEPAFGPPTRKYPDPDRFVSVPPRTPRVWLEGEDLPLGTPILTTDYFEFGTSTNGLETQGCGVEMGDAVLGMVAAELGDTSPRWLVVRNASDPQINGALPEGSGALDMGAHWAVFYYEAFGYWTSVCSALVCWGLIAGE